MKTKKSLKSRFAIQLSCIAFITFFLTTQAYAQVPTATWGSTVKAEDKTTFARIFVGAVHIGPAHNHPTNLSTDFASIAALEDSNLFVEGGIATENMTYIFEEDWDEWPDYVFNEDYTLTNLDELEAYILKNKHLPGVSTQKEVKEKGVSDKQMNITLLEKIEELTLYTIEQHKKLQAQDNKLQAQEKLNTTLLEGLKALEEKVSTMSNQK